MAFATFAFSACSKNEPKTTTPVDSNAMKYTINGVTDKSIDWNTDTIMMPLSLVYEKGNQEKVTLSVEGLPAHMYPAFETKTGVPSFSTIMYLCNQVSKTNPGGSYNLKVVAKTDKDSIKSIPMQLTVGAPPPPCEQVIAGKYNNLQVSPALNDVSGETTIEVIGKEKILLKNFVFIDGFSEDMEGTVDCDKQTISLIRKEVVSRPGYAIVGYGDIKGNVIEMHMIITFETVNYRHLGSTLTKK
jgi:hypothetical protein